jgi:hypothetical protein
MNGPVNQAQLQQLAETAQGALKRLRPDQAREPLQRLAALLPQNPSVLMLLRWAAVLEMDWPATREPITLSRRSPPAADAVDLVLFHVDLPAAPSGLHGRIDYWAVAALSFEAAKHRAPRARRVLLTDEHTQVPDELGAHEVIRTPINRDWLMYQRMHAQERYLATRPLDRATVLMDVDVVPNRDPSGIFAEDFHVGLTWRPEFPDAPVNGGLIFVGPGAEGHAFFRQAIRCYDSLAVDGRLASLFDRDLRSWWGDQYALALMVEYRRFASREHDTFGIDGARVRLFPCADYNFTPEAGRSYTADFLDSRYFLHFKGNRKAMQAQYLSHMRAVAAAPQTAARSGG